MRLFLIALLLTSFCHARINVAQPTTAGTSSWYGKREQGKRTANGERFDRRKMTCASRTYALGTLLMVRYPEKGTFVMVRVNDRGPFVAGRSLDLSEKAADILGLKSNGIGIVDIVPISLEGRMKELPLTRGYKALLEEQ